VTRSPAQARRRTGGAGASWRSSSRRCAAPGCEQIAERGREYIVSRSIVGRGPKGARPRAAGGLQRCSLPPDHRAS
jgi:hypothetical protein